MDPLFSETMDEIYKGMSRLTVIQQYLAEGKWFNINDLENWASHEFPKLRSMVQEVDHHAIPARRTVVHQKILKLVTLYIQVRAFADKLVASRAKHAKKQ